MSRIFQHLKSWFGGYLFIVFIIAAVTIGRFNLVVTPLKIVGSIVAIGLVLGIPLSIISITYNAINRKSSKIGKVLSTIAFIALVTSVFYFSISYFIEAVNTHGGAIIHEEIGELWHSESHLKREKIGIGSILFCFGCILTWCGWKTLRTNK